jgi:hypothetical protein
MEGPFRWATSPTRVRPAAHWQWLTRPMSTFDPATGQTEREEILTLLADTIRMTHVRIERFEAETPEEQELLIKWIRALGYLSGQYRTLLRDEDLDVLEEDVDLLKMVSGLEER